MPSALPPTDPLTDDAPVVPVLSGRPTARAWVIAVAVVILQLAVLAWGLSVQP